ncbi:MAG: single-stranded DNA-binding protein [Synergistaceae bacterium]|nr:single-stranded DNA-binding protein [Synergistaceae bacterium]
MRGFNRAIIAGNLTKDPEVRYTVNKKAFARFTLAVSSRTKNAEGEYQDTADYITVVAWNATAETCGKYLKKGSPVLVEGRIRTGSYDAKDGSGKRYTTEVWIDNMVMLGSGQGSSSGQNSGSGANYSSSSGGYAQMPQSMNDDSGYGMSIGESNFGGDISQGFSGGNANDETDIPF